ncbi:hypothetical protein BJV74DRAFT_918634 [Russula compacta]|nr:hypothetical protein BJV74DRAFT_918634 [Russula compacta]
MDVTKEGLGDLFETNQKRSSAMIIYSLPEHMHDHEEIRYIISVSGFWDVR